MARARTYGPLLQVLRAAYRPLFRFFSNRLSMSLSASHQSFSSTPKIAVIESPPVAKLWLLGAYNRIFWVSPRVANWPQPIANATQARTYKMQLLHFKSRASASFATRA